MDGPIEYFFTVPIWTSWFFNSDLVRNSSITSEIQRSTHLKQLLMTSDGRSKT
ncbi:hypothetical protein Hanom_Chr12g01086311 [Helianthus anomalus]